MTIDLSHNRIVRETVTEGFRESLCSVLLPRLSERLSGICRIAMYEDYLADGFARDGVFYYPLTVESDAGVSTVWITIPFGDKKSFAGESPFSYVGDEPLDIGLADSVPSEFSLRIAERSVDIPVGVIKIDVQADSLDPLSLVGKYSQTFIDELAVQITAELRRNLGVEGFDESTIELRVVFAPGTYMEHTSEGVTYRRLLLVEKGCQPRDFWVKWHRTDGKALSATVNEHLGMGAVCFALGEDVPQKIREKEFRFLAFNNPDKYQAAMGKRTVTEWRDIIKRAIKRGELVKLEADTLESTVKRDIDREIASILGEKKTKTASPEVEDGESFASVLDLARRTLSELEDSRASEGGVLALGLGELSEASEGIDGADGIEASDTADNVDTADTAEAKDSVPFDIFSDTESADFAAEALGGGFASSAEDLGGEDGSADRDVLGDSRDTSSAEADRGGEDNLANSEDRQTSIPTSDSARVSVQTGGASLDALEAMRAEIEAQVRLEYERLARERAEREADSLKAESDALRAENERLLAIAKKAEEDKEREISERERLASEEKSRYETETERLRRELERRDREEERERDRLAEAARLAVIEQKRIESERLEQQSREEERLMRERIEAERRSEAERIRALEAQRQSAASASAPVTPAAGRGGYMSKRATLIFRKTVDLNVIKRIKEIVEQTLVIKGKKQVQIHMKAYPKDSSTICLDVLRMPREEEALLVDIIKAIGTAGLGISKITLE